MWPFNISLPDGRIDTNQAVQDNLHDTSYEVSGLHSSSKLCKSKQSSSSKTASIKEKCPAEVLLQEMGKLVLSETSEAKKKLRKEISMWPFNISLRDGRIDTNQAVQDNLYDTSYEVSGLQSSSKLCKSKQSSSSKTASIKEKSPAQVLLHEMEKLMLSETSEAKKKRRKERNEKKKEQKKNKMEKESETRGSSDSHEYRRSVSCRSVSSLQGCELRTIEEVDEYSSIRKELKAVRVKMLELQREHDMAVDKATKVSIQLAYLKAITDESRDQLTVQLTESHALVEEMRAMRQQESPISPGTLERAMCQQGSPILPGALKCGFISCKKAAKSVMSSNRSVVASNRSVASSNRSVASSNWSDMSSNADISVDACNPFFL